MNGSVLSDCPACGAQMEVVRLRCPACGVAVEGRFSLTPFGRLSAEQVEFVKLFLASRGNIRLMERRLGVSYPTVRNRLRQVQRALGLADLAGGQEERADVHEVLKKLEAGEISVDDAIRSLD